MVGQLFLLFILIIFNAYFSSIEISLISLNEAKIHKMAKEGNKKAKKIEKMILEPSKFLATIQIGITLAGFLSSAFASEAFANIIVEIISNNFKNLNINIVKTFSIILVTIILSYFTLVFGELVPKRIAMKYYEKISFASINVIQIIAIIAAPFVKILTFSTNSISQIFGISEQDEVTITEDEIRLMIEEGEEKGSIQQEEKEMIYNIFEFNDITAGEVMTHRKDVYAVDINSKVEYILKEIDNYKYSRIPVYDETIDEIQGILFVKDLLKYILNKKSIKIKNIMRKAYFVSETKPINELFKDMQKNKLQMAIVVDEYGGTAGIVTMEDLLEEIVGNIFDEYDDFENEYEKIDENTFMVNGNININDFKKISHIEISEGDYDTLSGYLLETIGRVPSDDEKAIIETTEAIYKIEKIKDRRITKVKVYKNK